jgi:hypothetical protein
VALWTTQDPEVLAVKHYRCVVDAASTLRGRRGREIRDPRQVVQELINLQGTGSLPMTDELGRSLSVRLEPNLKATLAERDEGRGWVALVELDVTVLRTHVLFDAGYAYDTAEQYA